jgi:ABC-type multidrug transport system permease subunit
MVTFELKFTWIDKIKIAMSVQWDNYGIGGTIIFNLFVFFFLACLLVVAPFTTQQK